METAATGARMRQPVSLSYRVYLNGHGRSSIFPVKSRYHKNEKEKWTSPEGKEYVYLRRRFLPPAGSTQPLTEHTVTQDERLDHITAQYLGDPELFWRLCDANNALHPHELTAEIGRRLDIPLFQEG